jgi:heat shock protein HslJ
LNGTEWMRADDADSQPHVATISFAERRASGFTGCRTWLAMPSRRDDRLHFGGVSKQGHSCPTQSAGGAAERSFLRALDRVQRGVIENGELVFYDGSGAQIARFTQTNPPAVAANTTPEAPSQPAPAMTAPSTTTPAPSTTP